MNVSYLVSIIQALMGVFYHIHSVALVEDLPGNEGHFATAKDYYDAVDKGFSLVSTYLI